MVEVERTTPPSSPDTRTLADIVSTLARRASDGVLAILAIVGVTGVVAIALFLRFAWWLTPLMLGAAAFGTWGIADRERAAIGVRGNVFRIVRLLAVFVGGAAAAFAAVMLFIVFVGTLQS